jgi:RNA polymerase sigma factor (sigma-70 family)
VNSLSDQQLLRSYAQHRSEPAFTELVRRHVDLVYSAAFRMLRDAHLAEDVTQSAFVALAQSAGQLSDRLVLSDWLHRTAQNIASKSVRSDVRRRAREQEVIAMNELLSTEPDVAWEHIEPHLDEALGGLSDPDRDALFLRYFEGKSAREMAQSLGTTEDAAQKRVSRAVERLRVFFAKRGVTIGASGLVIAISANAVQAAPAGLAVTISGAAATLVGTSIDTATTATATKAIVMTTLQKTIIGAALAIAIGTGTYEARQTARLREQNHVLQQQQAPLAEQIQQLAREPDNATRQLAALHEENERLNRNQAELLKLRGEVGVLRNAAQDSKPEDTDPIRVAAKSWLAKVDVLKKWIAQRPEQQIPEFQYLLDYDWLDAVKTSNMMGDYAPGNAAIGLREAAKRQFAHELSNALRRFVAEHDGQLPADLAQLNAYMQQPMNDAILKSYRLLHAGKLADLPGKEWLVAEIAPPFDKNDWRRMMIRTDDYIQVSREK